jgi:hypothetical protein
MTRDENEILAKAMTAYKNELKREIEAGGDLVEYNTIELAHVDETAIRLDLVGDYFELEKS